MLKCATIGIITGLLMKTTLNYPFLCLTIFICGLYIVWHLRELF
jgi:hypothetical protein